MENNMKRFLSLLLALVMVIGLMPVGHVHAEEQTYLKIAEQVAEVEANASYVICLHGTKKALTNQQGSGAWGTHTLATAACGDFAEAQNLWTLETAEGGYKIKNAGGYLLISRNTANLNETGHIFELVYHGDAGWAIKSLETNEYGNNLGDSGSIGGWSGDGTKFDLYKVVEMSVEEADPFGKLRGLWKKVSVDTETVYNETEGLFEYAWDNDTITRWHSNWQGASDKLNGSNTFSGVIDFGQAYVIDQFSFLPRQDNNNSGQVTQASLYVKEHEGDEWIAAAEHVTFEASSAKKDINFPVQAVRYVKFVAEQSNDGWVAVGEFYIDRISPVHEHSWVDATCTAPKTCATCGETEGEALGHKPGEAVIENEVAATCSEDGSFDTVVYCSVCSEELSRETTTVDALGHTEEVIPGKDATCTETGLTEGKKCTVCGVITVAQQEIAALGHKPGEATHENEVAPDCTTDGSYESVIRCSVCSAELSRETVTVPALGHKDEDNNFKCDVCSEDLCTEHVEELVKGSAATCTEPGLTDGKKCTVCGETTVAQQVIPALGHNYEAVVTAPDCVTGGCTTYTCTVCGDTYIDDMVPALGHKYETVVTAPTCTTGGYTTYTCSVCAHSYVSDETSALGHTPGEMIRENEVIPTCTLAGSYDIVVSCSVCGAQISRETVAVDALGHRNTELRDAVAPTLTNEGYTGDTFCNDCQRIIAFGEVIPMLSAMNAKILSNGTILALDNCMYVLGGETNGSYSLSHAGTYYVKPCANGNNVVNTTEKFAQLTLETTWEGKAEDDHTIRIKGLDGRDTGAGYIHVWTEGKDQPYWDRCTTAHGPKDIGTDGLYLFYKNEDGTGAEIPGYSMVTNGNVETGKSYLIAAKKGESTWYIMMPSVSTEKFDQIAQVVTDAVTHTHEYTTTTQAATCTVDGLKTDTCQCGHFHTEVIPATGEHDWNAATCTAPKTCATCGATEGEALGHTASEAVKENEKAATCTETGSYDSVVYCSVCSAEMSRETITVDALGHKPGEATRENEVAPDCTTDGSYESVIRCSVCSAELSRETVAVPALGHKDEDNNFECDVCGEDLCTEHVEEIVKGYAATCTESGLTDGKKCTICGETTVAQQEIPALGHNYEAVVTAPTCTEGGYTTYTCSRCGDTYTGDETAALGHTASEAVKENEKAPTCTETGSYDSVVYCSVCSAEMSRETVTVAAEGHKPGEAVRENEVAPTLNSEGSYDSVVYCSVCSTELSRTPVTVPVLEGAVAQVNGVKYATLAEAIEKASGNMAVHMLADTSEDIVIDKALILLMNSHTLYGQVKITGPNVQIQGCINTSTDPKGKIVAEGKDAIVIGVKDQKNENISVYANFVDVTSTTDCALLIYDGRATFNNSDLTSTSTSYAAVQGSGRDFGDVSMSLCNVTSEHEVAIYWPHVGTLTVNNDCTITGATGLYIKQGKANLYSCTVKGTGAQVAHKVNNNGGDSTGDAITIDKGATEPVVNTSANLISENGNLVGMYGGTVELFGANLTAKKNAIRMEDGVLTLRGMTINAGYCALFIRGGEVTMSGTTMNSTGDYATIQGNGTCGGDVTIRSGTVSSANNIAIYWPGSGNLNIASGTITGATAIYAKQGNVTISGGTFRATGEKADFSHSGNGAYATGDAVVLESCDYGTLTASITYGQFISDHGKAVAAYAQPGHTELSGFITGGHYNTEVDADYLAEGYCAALTGEYYSVAQHYYFSEVTDPDCENGGYTTHTCGRCGDSYVTDEIPALGHTPGEPVRENEVAPTLNSKGSYDSVVYCSVCSTELSRTTVTVPVLEGAVAQVNGVKYATLTEAIEKAPANMAVNMLADVTEDIVIDKALTLVMNSHTLYGQIKTTAPLLQIQGCINSNTDPKGKIVAEGKDAIVIGVKDQKNENISVLANFVEVTSTTDCAVLIYDGSATFNHADLTSTSTSYAAVQGSGRDFGDITLNGSTVTSEHEVAIYWPHVGKLNVTPSSTITGATGLYIKQGTATLVPGTTVKATGAQVAHKVNNNGGDSTGDAITVDKGATEAVVNVQAQLISENGNLVGIYGGTFNLNSSGLTAKKNAFRVEGGTLNINGGSVGAGYSAVFIRGGEVNTYGASLYSTGIYAAIQGNGLSGGDVSLHGGSVRADNAEAIYWPGSGSLTVEGTTISGLTGIYAKQGNVTILGAVVTAIGEKADYEHGSNGSTPTGDAVVLESCDYGTLTAFINGGTFVSEYGKAVAAYAQPGYTELSGFITGGQYNTEVDADYLAEGYCAALTGEYYSVAQHSYFSEVTAPDCENGGYTTHTCGRCGDSYVTDEIPALGHKPGEAVVENEKAATCTETGSYDSVVYCSVCSAEMSRETVTVDALGHTEEVIPGKDATCTEPGLTEGKKCTVCGETTVAQEEIPALGHDWLEDGSCSRCEEKKDDSVTNPFVDIPADEYYLEPVLWAVEKGITAGTSANTFSPYRIITRGEAVTFLWRAMGSPEPALMINPFADVTEADYYYKAVLWAAEKGITAGVGNNRFAPGQECTRAQILTFLWVAMGKPASDAEVTFNDVQVGDYYYTAVAWAYEKGVTAGVGGGAFGVNVLCNRAQVITFLYRAVA